MEKLFELLHLAWRQENAVYRIGEIFSSAFAGGFSFKKLIAVIVAFFEMFGCVLFDMPLTPAGSELNLEGYSLVFEDEFEGDSLNEDCWFYRASGDRRNGFNAASQVRVEGGNLIMTAEYLEDGEFGPGWYAGMISLRQKYCRGYFEIKCKCNDGGDFWSAFWIQADNPYNHDVSKGGPGGAELDIFEAPYGNKKGSPLYNSVTQTIHCNGLDDDKEHIDSRMLGVFKADNIYSEYNTYGLEWTEDEYIFYINGVETARTSFGSGVSQVEESVIVSLEI
ncbi:MAG: family 16 glycosylhydrolase, partial [Clostridia bacterium]|nr:family 16 glycosylhydrolase [Clostridia bacterium]